MLSTLFALSSPVTAFSLAQHHSALTINWTSCFHSHRSLIKAFLWRSYPFPSLCHLCELALHSSSGMCSIVWPSICILQLSTVHSPGSSEASYVVSGLSAEPRQLNTGWHPAGVSGARALGVALQRRQGCSSKSNK